MTRPCETEKADIKSVTSCGQITFPITPRDRLCCSFNCMQMLCLRLLAVPAAPLSAHTGNHLSRLRRSEAVQLKQLCHFLSPVISAKLVCLKDYMSPPLPQSPAGNMSSSLSLLKFPPSEEKLKKKSSSIRTLQVVKSNMRSEAFTSFSL